MPRINRYTVEFPAAGKTYRASFDHQHDEDATGELTLKGTREQLPLRHITTCYLGDIEASSPEDLSEGVSFCAAADYYDWRKGNKMALLRAITKLGITREDPRYGEFLGGYYRELRVPATETTSAH